jgi:hypothetical protein
LSGTTTLDFAVIGNWQIAARADAQETIVRPCHLVSRYRMTGELRATFRCRTAWSASSSARCG